MNVIELSKKLVFLLQKKLRRYAITFYKYIKENNRTHKQILKAAADYEEPYW